MKICDFSNFDYLVVDTAPPETIQNILIDAGLRVVVAENELNSEEH